MTHVLYRISRGVCPASDRIWLEALFAESDAVEPGRARLLWLLGALGLLLDRYSRRLVTMVSPASLACLLAAVVFGILALVEYEGLAPEDDWYGLIAAVFLAGVISLSIVNLKKHTPGAQP